MTSLKWMETKNLFNKLMQRFFFNDTATTEIYTLSLHDALPILPGGEGDGRRRARGAPGRQRPGGRRVRRRPARPDRKSTLLNSSHANISYAVFCLQKKKPQTIPSAISPHLTHLTYVPSD